MQTSPSCSLQCLPLTPAKMKCSLELEYRPAAAKKGHFCGSVYCLKLCKQHLSIELPSCTCHSTLSPCMSLVPGPCAQAGLAKGQLECELHCVCRRRASSSASWASEADEDSCWEKHLQMCPAAGSAAPVHQKNGSVSSHFLFLAMNLALVMLSLPCLLLDIS